MAALVDAGVMDITFFLTITAKKVQMISLILGHSPFLKSDDGESLKLNVQGYTDRFNEMDQESRCKIETFVANIAYFTPREPSQNFEDLALKYLQDRETLRSQMEFAVIPYEVISKYEIHLNRPTPIEKQFSLADFDLILRMKGLRKIRALVHTGLLSIEKVGKASGASLRITSLLLRHSNILKDRDGNRLRLTFDEYKKRFEGLAPEMKAKIKEMWNDVAERGQSVLRRCEEIPEVSQRYGLNT